MAKKKSKRGPKKVPVTQLKATIKSQKEEIAKLKEQVEFLSGTLKVEGDKPVEIAPFVIPIEQQDTTKPALKPGEPVECPVVKEVEKKNFTNQGFGVRLSESGQYLLDTISYDPEDSNIETKQLCKGDQRAHAEFEIKKMLAYGQIVPDKKRS